MIDIEVIGCTKDSNDRGELLGRSTSVHGISTRDGLR